MATATTEVSSSVMKEGIGSGVVVG
jgi:hypothetical protein